MINNVPEKKSEHIEDMRGAFEHRAAWMYLLIKEAQKRGLDYSFAHDAIRNCGCYHGDNKYTKTDDMLEFAKEFANQNVVDIFQMDVDAQADHMNIDFHYCPLVAAWKKLGATDEECAELCQIAMDGDRGIASTFPHFEFHLGKTIAAGDDVCEIRFKKV